MQGVMLSHPKTKVIWYLIQLGLIITKREPVNYCILDLFNRVSLFERLHYIAMPLDQFVLDTVDEVLRLEDIRHYDVALTDNLPPHPSECQIYLVLISV